MLLDRIEAEAAIPLEAKKDEDEDYEVLFGKKEEVEKPAEKPAEKPKKLQAAVGEERTRHM